MGLHMGVKMERLDKFLVSQNVGSRKEVGLLARRGGVTVNGIPVFDSGAKIDPEKDQVQVAGVPVVYQKFLYIMMNKPADVLSATEDKRSKTVLDLLPENLYRPGLFPAGRLDKDTTGLLIITDDGDFAHRMLSPKKQVYKLYRAQTQRPVTPEDVEAFARGIQFGKLQYHPAELVPGGEGEENFAYTKIREGKFHQVKRMFEAVGNQVLHLERLKIGDLNLDNLLQAGEARLLTEEEKEAIFSRQLVLKPW